MTFFKKKVEIIPDESKTLPQFLKLRSAFS